MRLTIIPNRILVYANNFFITTTGIKSLLNTKECSESNDPVSYLLTCKLVLTNKYTNIPLNVAYNPIRTNNKKGKNNLIYAASSLVLSFMLLMDTVEDGVYNAAA